jgi:hypothetical protein
MYVLTEDKKLKEKGKVFKFIVSNILTRTGISAIVVLAVIFFIGAVRLGNSSEAFSKAFANTPKTSVTERIKGFEKDFNNNFESLQKVSVDVTSLADNAQGKRVMQTPTMLLAFDTDGLLHRIMPNINITKKLANLKEVMLRMKNKNYNTIYVAVPSSVIKGKTVLPSGVTDFENATIDKVIKTLKIANIRTLDLRQEFTKDGIDPQDIFYNTDHHWKIPYSFQGAMQIARYLNASYKLNLDPNNVYSNINNYTSKTIPKVYGGSYMDAGGSAFVGDPDDFTSLIPKFATDYRFRSYTSKGEIQHLNSGSKKAMDYTGTFPETLYDGRPTYMGYYNGGNTEIRVNNNFVANNLKCMVVGTSNARPASAFLSTYFKELRFIDTQGGRFSQNLYTYVDDYDPDVVLFMYPGWAFDDPNVFNYVIK